MSSSASSKQEDDPKQQKLALVIGDQSIYLLEDWGHGIGGGLWSTGLALAKYLGTDHAFRQLGGIQTVLELGSGNGFLSVCLLAAAAEATTPLQQVTITDTKEHLPLMEKTLQANQHIVDKHPSINVSVQEYLWGTPPAIPGQYDLIIGSDLAYRDYLHDPLIESLLLFSSPTTVTLLGVTFLDTKPIFFDKLSRAGFTYERLADHLLDASFRGTSFGVFVIQKAKH